MAKSTTSMIVLISAVTILLQSSCRRSSSNIFQIRVAIDSSGYLVTLPTSEVIISGKATPVYENINADTYVKYFLSWQQMSGPKTVSLGTPITDYATNGSATSSVHISGLSEAGEYVFRLTATDAFNRVVTDDVIVTVLADTTSTNQPPIANAGADTTIILPVSSVALSGGGTDPEGDSISYAWIQISGTAAIIESPAAATTNITGLTTAGERVFRLTLTDDKGATGSSDVTITVLPANTGTFSIGSNIYSVNKIIKNDKSILVESIRNNTDSGSVKFTFNKKLTAFGTSEDFKVVKTVMSDDEVSLNVTRVKGTDGTFYASTGSDNVKIKVTVDSKGKFTIKMPVTVAQRVLETETVEVSADITES